MLDLAQYQIEGPTASRIATTAEAAIREGRLRSGAPLPTVRALAAALQSSPATVNSAYRILRERGLIVTDGRRGTRVAPRPPLRLPDPAASVPALPDAAGKRDLASGLPDPELLPPVAAAVSRVDFTAKLAMTELDRADTELIALAAAAFGADGVPAG